MYRADLIKFANEKRAIDEVAAAFGLSNIEMFYTSFEREFGKGYNSRQNYRENYRQEYRQDYNQSYNESSQSKDPYEVLGVSKTASFDEVKKKYRELVRKYHPDFLENKNDANESAKRTKKTQEINEAYEKIKSIKGWK